MIPRRSGSRTLGWQRGFAAPGRAHAGKVSALPRRRRLAEFTAIKGVDVSWRTGWVSDRAAAFLALGRPVITEETGAERYLPQKSGMFFVGTPRRQRKRRSEFCAIGQALAREARECAVEVFDSAKNLRKILGI